MMIGIAMFHQLGSGTLARSGSRSSWFAKGIGHSMRERIIHYKTPMRRRLTQTFPNHRTTPLLTNFNKGLINLGVFGL
jgi:hypothetical protein